MISFENKLKVINGKLVHISPNQQIYAYTDTFGGFIPVVRMHPETHKYCSILVNYTKSSNSILMYLHKYNKYKIELGMDQYHFNKMDKEEKSLIEEYCQWIVSQDAINLINRINNLKAFS